MSLGASLAALEMARAIRIVVLEADATQADGRIYADALVLPGEELVTVELAGVEVRRLPRAGEAWLAADPDGDMMRVYLLAPLPGALADLMPGMYEIRTRDGEGLALVATGASAALDAGQDFKLRSGVGEQGSAASLELLASGKVRLAGAGGLELLDLCATLAGLCLEMATQAALVSVASFSTPTVNAPAFTALGAQLKALQAQINTLRG